MTAPGSGLIDVVSEFYLGGWQDASTDVKLVSGMTVRGGIPPETDNFQQPCGVNFSLMNPSGKYSQYNPTGPYYGMLRRNTPCRIATRQNYDRFARTAVNGWGTAPLGPSAAGPTWSLEGTAASFAVTPGAATHSVTGTSTWVDSYLTTAGAGIPTPDYGDVEVKTTWSYGAAAVTGAPIEPGNIMLCRQSATSYYLARVQIATSGVISVGILRVNGVGTSVTLAAPVATGLTHVAGQKVAVKFHSDGQTLRAKVWLDANKEPFNWTVSAVADLAPSYGTVGVRTGVAGGNTNANPVVVTYYDYQVLTPRVFGEVAEWPEEWDEAEVDVVITLQVNGILRRLSTGKAPVQSILRRTLPNLTGMRAYWALEDGRNSTSFASGLESGLPMATVIGSPSFAAFTGIASSNAMVTCNSARWGGYITPYSPTGSVVLRWLENVPAGGVGTGDAVCNVWTDGTARFWEVLYVPGGGGQMQVRCWRNDGSLAHDSGALSPNVDGKNFMVSLELQNSGANIAWTLAFLEVGAVGGFFFTGTAVGVQLGMATQVNCNANAGALTSVSLGHVTVQDVITSIFAFADQLNSYAGETALTRATRLTTESAIPFSVVDGPLTTQPMGPQSNSKNTIGLLQDCIDTEHAVICESKFVRGLVWHSLDTLMNQVAVMTVDYAQHHVNGIKPRSDDLLTRNLITVTRDGGSSVTVEQKVGPLGTADPELGGVGPYPTAPPALSLSKDSQLLDQATWLLRTGTYDAPRYELLAFNRRNPDFVLSGQDSRLLSLFCGARLVMNNPRLRHGPGPVSQIVRNWTETLTPDTHLISFSTVPEGPYRVLQFDAATRFGSGGTTTTADPGTAGLSLAITVSNATPWSTDPADYPMNLKVNGEVMTASTCSAAVGAAQTFTISARSVNGVVRAHPTGSGVTLDTLWAWALG